MIADLFIKRPKFAIVIAILMMLAGGICLNQLPIAEYPEIAPTSINVQATYTGASAQVVMETLASPIEEELNGLENLLYFSSKSDNTGGYSLSLTFKSGTNSDINMVNVQNALKRVEYKLPKEVTDQGIKIRKRSSDILGFFAFRSTSMSSLELNKTRVKDEVARVPGISAVNLMPEKNYSMRIWLDALRMSALNITPDDVSNAIKAQNVQAAAGSIGSEGENNFIQYKVNVTGRLQTVEEFSKIIVRTGQDGHVTRLDDIARIELGAETYTGSSRNNGEDSVNMAVYRLDDANALEAMNGVKDTLEKLEKRFPEGVSYVVSYDPTQYISATMAEIVETLVIALILVVGITYLFLQDWRATLIPALAIPVSLIGTFAILLPLGFSINVLTMFGLILVIGSLVDDGIIVVENTMRILETEDLSPEEHAPDYRRHHRHHAGDGSHLRAHRLLRRHGGEHLHAILRNHVRGPLPFRNQFPDAQPRAVRSAAEKEAKETEQVQPLPPLQRLSGMGAQKLYQMRRHHGAPRVAYADSAGRCPGRQLETV